MKRTHSDVRSMCREMYGKEWWNVDSDTKRKRQDAALNRLQMGRKNAEEDTATPDDEKQLRELLQKCVPRAGNITVSRLDPPLKQCYESLRRVMNPPNEHRWLFHGTTQEAVPKIVTEGYNRSFCGKNATVYGQGVYFAKDIAYSAQTTYSPVDSSGFRHILASRVLVGNSCVGRSDQKVPDMFDSTQRYDTTVNSLKQPTIFVVYKDMQAIPEYHIKFKL